MTGISILTRLASVQAQPRAAAEFAVTAAFLRPTGLSKPQALTRIHFLVKQSLPMVCLFTSARSFVSGKQMIRDDRGSAAIEFSLVLPVFLVMVIGIFAVGWAAHSTHNLRHALAEGARALQLKPT